MMYCNVSNAGLAVPLNNVLQIKKPIGRANSICRAYTKKLLEVSNSGNLNAGLLTAMPLVRLINVKNPVSVNKGASCAPQYVSLPKRQTNAISTIAVNA